jgi:sugar lactone lactonase YvrE
MGIRFTLTLAGIALAAACTPEPEAPAPETAAPPPPPAAAPTAAPPAAGDSIPDTITAERGGFIPEGVEYDQANRRFLTGSLAEGTIFEFHTDGRVTPVVTDAELVSSVGIEVDEPRDRLLVANSDRSVFQPGNVGQAKLAVYNLTTGERLAMVDLAAVIGQPSDPPAYFANDVAVGADGTAYVTDTRMNVVYRVTPAYEASVLHRFTGLQDGAALNGIVYHDDGYLLVAAGQQLFKVPVDDPGSASEVMVAEPVPGSDGMVWAADGRLVITSNSADNPRVVALTSSDGWATAQTAGSASMNGQVTTAAAVGDEIYAVHPHFADAEPPSIERARFQ